MRKNRKNGMGLDIVYNFNSEDGCKCTSCSVIIQIEVGLENILLGRMIQKILT